MAGSSRSLSQDSDVSPTPSILPGGNWSPSAGVTLKQGRRCCLLSLAGGSSPTGGRPGRPWSPMWVWAGGDTRACVTLGGATRMRPQPKGSCSIKNFKGGDLKCAGHPEGLGVGERRGACCQTDRQPGASPLPQPPGLCVRLEVTPWAAIGNMFSRRHPSAAHPLEGQTPRWDGASHTPRAGQGRPRTRVHPPRKARH